MLSKRKAKKGLSGAVTALILVIASVIIALVVVGFAFGLFGAFGGTPTVSAVGSGVIYYSSGSGYAIITLKSSGSVEIVSAELAGTTYSGTAEVIGGSGSSSTLSAGVNTVSISFSQLPPLQSGSTYTISLALSDGATVQVSVIAQ
ncbi:DUF973 family protein [Sulfurisphaera tokodaii]|uniref:DUF973 family protein n=2 Tax=Sulfurisphaera tokodaii TaxID=111955 RepID=Q976P9_SULTO|nr:DUF973 family protein [Sulfurisphaera tokodaii]BAB65097.1 hypothetical protein STK_01410 [Sulfurisphaera tokodaii str. 7]HII74106.1 DUF973 family protein [Sulfurisphaera tokodaii]